MNDEKKITVRISIGMVIDWLRDHASTFSEIAKALEAAYPSEALMTDVIKEQPATATVKLKRPSSDRQRLWDILRASKQTTIKQASFAFCGTDDFNQREWVSNTLAIWCRKGDLMRVAKGTYALAQNKTDEHPSQRPS